MKTSLTNSLLDEARSAETAGQLGEAIDKIRERIGAMIIERDELQRTLQDAIMSGRDQAKAQTALEAADRDAVTLEAAMAAFARRLDELTRKEKADEIVHLKARAAQTAEQLAIAATKWAAAGGQVRVCGHEVSDLARNLDRQNAQLEGLGLRIERRSSPIVRAAIGDIPSTPLGLSEYGKRCVYHVIEMLSDLPSNLRRRQNPRRGRLGESNAAKDQVAYGVPTGIRA
jgi:chromosome segregation ATPase